MGDLSPFFHLKGIIMLSTTLRKLLSLLLINVSLLFNPCHASDSNFGDPHDDSDAESSHTTSAGASVGRFVPDSKPDASVIRFTLDRPPSSHEVSADDAATIAGEINPAEGRDVANGTFTHTIIPIVTTPSKALLLADVDEYVNVTNTQPGFTINDGMFTTLIIPESITPYKMISLVRCVCFNSLDPSSFQNNLALTHIILTGSHLNFLGSEEKLGEGCPKLEHIDLRGTADLSIDKDTPITPERFAQLIHPDVLLRILSAQCNVSILNPEHEGTCYTVDEMKAKFLRSVVELRSAQKSQEGIYQRIMAVLAAGINEFDHTKLAGVGVRAAIKACTGI
jgi:hypothetical protein